jgi:hypothetical protein
VERAEREALGPVRRGPDEPPPPLLEPTHADPRGEHDGEWDEDDEHDEHVSGPHDDVDFESYEREFADDDEFVDEPAPPPVQMAPPQPSGPAPEPLRFSEESPPAPPSAHDPHEPSTAEFFEAAPSAREHFPPAPAGPEDEPLRPPPGDQHDATAEFDVQEAIDEHDESPARADDDMLEETPEFLSDTPDHDRLWFEQKPPRDFDFDG